MVDVLARLRDLRDLVVARPDATDDDAMPAAPTFTLPDVPRPRRGLVKSKEPAVPHPRAAEPAGFAWIDLESAMSPLAMAFDDGFQLLSGLSFDDGIWELKKHNCHGAAVLAVPEAGDDLTPRERQALEAGVKDELAKLRDERNIVCIAAVDVNTSLDQCASLGRMGFAALLVDGLDAVAGPDDDVADIASFLTTMAARARQAAKNHDITLVLLGAPAAERLLAARPELARDGVVGAVVVDGASYRAVGRIVPDAEQQHLQQLVASWRADFSLLPLVAVDVPSTRAQSERAMRRAKELGFHVAHVAFDDGARTKVHQRKLLARVE